VLKELRNVSQAPRKEVVCTGVEETRPCQMTRNDGRRGRCFVYL
jgi:hypothetical protein